MKEKNITQEPFSWFIGVVEDREDPMELGRVRVRIYNVHPQDKTQVPTQDLPWALLINSPSNAALTGVGISPTGMMVGTTVVGFFVDSTEQQIPMIFGSVHGIKDGKADAHDVAMLARGRNTISKSTVGPEPASSYKSKYPFNKTITTESGHVIELDDTPGGERIHVYHKSGSYVEISPSGARVDKINGKHVHVVTGESEVYVGSAMNITVQGSANIKVSGALDISAGGPINMNSGGSILIKGSVVTIDGAKTETY